MSTRCARLAVPLLAGSLHARAKADAAPPRASIINTREAALVEREAALARREAAAAAREQELVRREAAAVSPSDLGLVELRERVSAFAKERDWDQSHTVW